MYQLGAPGDVRSPSKAITYILSHFLLIFDSGLDRFEARKKVWSDLEETGLAVKKEPHVLRVPRSQRGGEVQCSSFSIKLTGI